MFIFIIITCVHKFLTKSTVMQTLRLQLSINTQVVHVHVYCLEQTLNSFTVTSYQYNLFKY